MAGNIRKIINGWVTQLYSPDGTLISQDFTKANSFVGYVEQIEPIEWEDENGHTIDPPEVRSHAFNEGIELVQPGDTDSSAQDPDDLHEAIDEE